MLYLMPELPILCMFRLHLYDLYSPVLAKRQFKTILTQIEYLLKNMVHYAILGEPCLTNLQTLLNLQNTSSCQ